MADQPLIVAAIPCSRQFREIERELLAIGGKNPLGEPRLKLEWGGTATRPFGEQLNCKFGLYSETCVVGWTFAGNPWAENPSDRETLYTDEPDLSVVPSSLTHFSTGKPRISIERLATIDHPIPNWFVTDWLSPAQMGRGFGYGRGYHGSIWRCYDAKRDEHPFWGYRDPDADDLVVVKRYWHEKIHDRDTLGTHIDEPIAGDAAALQTAWMNKAVAHLAEERRGNAIEQCVPIVERHLNEKYAGGPKTFIDLGETYVN